MKPTSKIRPVGTSVEIIIDQSGGVRHILDPEHDDIYAAFGDVVGTYRNSHVEPHGWFKRWLFSTIRKRVSDDGAIAAWTRLWDCHWRVNMTLVGGPIFGKFADRGAALAAEVKWLKEHNLPLPVNHDN
jgi:hypothetical protein